MKYIGKNYARGLTLIEVLLYSSLLSLLMVTCLSFIYGIHLEEIELFQHIDDAYASQPI